VFTLNETYSPQRRKERKERKEIYGINKIVIPAIAEKKARGVERQESGPKGERSESSMVFRTSGLLDPRFRGDDLQ
jgi:hypothetical protein